MDVVTKESGHQVTGMAVSVCLTPGPAPPGLLPIPHPTMGTTAEGLNMTPMRTKIGGSPILTVGSVVKACHGNDPGSLKEIVSMTTGGGSFSLMGAPTVLVERGMVAITGSPVMMNSLHIRTGAAVAGNAAGGPDAAGGGDAPAPPVPPAPPAPAAPKAGGGGGGGGKGKGKKGKIKKPGKSSAAKERDTCQGGHPVDLVSGAVVDKATELTLPGPIPFMFEQFYSSERSDGATATLGHGWAHGLEQSLDRETDLITLRDGECRSVCLARIAEGESTFHRRERLWLTRPSANEYRERSVDTRQTRLLRSVTAKPSCGARRTVSSLEIIRTASPFPYRRFGHLCAGLRTHQ
jgi:hypothetical protein